MVRSKSWVLGAVLSTVLLGLVLGACDDPQLEYVRSGEVQGSDATAFFKLPADWKLFDQDYVIADRGDSLSQQEIDRVKATQWVVVFDAAPKPALDNLSPDAPHPTGFAQVRFVESQAEYDLDALRNEVFPLDRLGQRDDFELIRDEDLTLPGRVEGFRVTFSYDEADKSATVDLLSALDPRTNVIYILVISCETACYEREKGAIEDILDSWTVESGLT